MTAMSSETLSIETHWHNIFANPFGGTFYYFNEISSTNVIALEMLRRENVSNGTLFVAERQSAGKGTNGKEWASQTGEGLWMSLLLLEPFKKEPLSFLPAVALNRILRADYGVVDAHLKWPNDVLVSRQKICGILCECRRQPDGKQVMVIGIGVNLNQQTFSDEVNHKAISLRQVINKKVCKPSFLDRLLCAIKEIYESDDSIVDLWRENTQMIGRSIRVFESGRERSVEVAGITDEGHLLVQDNHGNSERWVSNNNRDIDYGYA